MVANTWMFNSPSVKIFIYSLSLNVEVYHYTILILAFNNIIITSKYINKYYTGVSSATHVISAI